VAADSGLGRDDGSLVWTDLGHGVTMMTNDILLGAIAMACLTASLFFLKFWSTTKDRFFLFFALSFFMEGVCRFLLGVIDYSSEQEPLFYLIRLFSFLLILYAIAEKNWIGKRNRNIK
jgi:hypothetical protein